MLYVLLDLIIMYLILCRWASGPGVVHVVPFYQVSHVVSKQVVKIFYKRLCYWFYAECCRIAVLCHMF